MQQNEKSSGSSPLNVFWNVMLVYNAWVACVWMCGWYSDAPAGGEKVYMRLVRWDLSHIFGGNIQLSLTRLLSHIRVKAEIAREANSCAAFFHPAKIGTDSVDLHANVVHVVSLLRKVHVLSAFGDLS